MNAELIFKEAATGSDFEQIQALNHRVFADEIAQHPRHPSGLLLDPFHAQNRYFLALRRDVVIGMISANPGPCFSVSKRLPDPAILSSFARPLELRLLAIDPQARCRTVLAGLLWQVYDFARSAGFSHLLISAISNRESMYRKLGFHALGPAVPEGEAAFLPMALALDSHIETERRRIDLHRRHWLRVHPAARPISLLPGPVSIDPKVTDAYASFPISHRSAPFLDCFDRVKSLLRGFLPSADVVLLPGSGTLANDAVAANLKAVFENAPGLVISNGEFGERLAHQALSCRLRFHHLSFAWGEPWDFPAIQQAFEKQPAWAWAVQLETSTGVLNDTGKLLRIARARRCPVSLDCVSSIGAAPIAPAPEPLFFASGVSGKSIGSYAGLGFVFCSEEARARLAAKALPPSFDLLNALCTPGPVTTIPSAPLFALATALEMHYDSPPAVERRFEHYRLLGDQTRALMQQAGLQPLAAPAIAAPNITTFVLPEPGFPDQCLRAGYQIAHESCYLRRNHWGQIATMGALSLAAIQPLFDALQKP